MLYLFTSLGLSLDVVDAAIRSYKGFPPDVRIPEMAKKLKEGKGGRPRREAMLRMSGSQVMHFSLHR